MAANVNVAGTVWNCPNYVGELFLIGANQTPFLNMIGGLQGASIRTVAAFQFSLAQPWALEDASQPNISETASITAPNPWTYIRDQDVNTVQIFQRAVSVSYAKQSVIGQITADAVTGIAEVGVQPIQNEKDFQISAHMRQMSVNVDFTFLQGAYQQATSAAVAPRSRGIITGCDSNTVDASGAALSKALVDQLLRDMAGNGAEFINPVIFVNAFQKQKISDVYGYAPEDRNVGGVNIKQIETDFGTIGIADAHRFVPADDILLADMSTIAPVTQPVPGKGNFFLEELGKAGASENSMLYGQYGLDHGPAFAHGAITGLATS